MSTPNTHYTPAQIDAMLQDARAVYFLGIGGISVSSLACMTARQGLRVGGYDRTVTPLVRRLMDAGVKIYEYEPGFIHAKSYLVDGEYAMVGTINMDYRSLVHHFENGVWMYRTACIRDLNADMEKTLEKSIQVNEKNVKRGLLQRMLCAVIRVLAPLL